MCLKRDRRNENISSTTIAIIPLIIKATMNVSTLLFRRTGVVELVSFAMMINYVVVSLTFVKKQKTLLEATQLTIWLTLNTQRATSKGVTANLKI